MESRENRIKEFARKRGFSFCGISKAEFLEEEAGRLEQWLHKGMHGEMSYMENHFDKRLDPRLLVPGAQSVISLLFNYYPETQAKNDDGLKISSYAYGEDYHLVIKDHLHLLLEDIRGAFGAVEGRVFVDSAPVLDKAWAKRSGLGWIGKNANLINKGHGSFFFIAELIINLKLDPDGPTTDHCGTCTACLDACPTGAIIEPYVVDGSRCISYFTIELRKEIPQGFHQQLNDWIFGCDVCQDVCPWNRFSKPTAEPRFTPNRELLNLREDEWLDMSEEGFKRLAAHSPMKRSGLEGMKRNVRAVISGRKK